MNCRPDTIALAFLVMTGKLTLEDIANKVDKSNPPWWAVHKTLHKVLADAWEPEGKVLTNDIKSILVDAGDKVDREQVVHIIKSSAKHSARFVKRVRPKAQALYTQIQQGATTAFWNSVKSKEDPPNPSEVLRGKLLGQLDRFMEKYPERKLHPQIETLISQMEESPSQRRALLDNLDERFDALARDDSYWDALSSTQASYLWNAQGIATAEEHGIASYTILNPMDNKTCIVCKRLHGAVFPISKAKKLIDSRGEIDDPDELNQKFPFPREATIGQLGMGDLEKSDFCLPPYHPNCRDIVKFIYLRGV